jgi:ribosomal protein S18 acetylase RimI-like enzyme
MLDRAMADAFDAAYVSLHVRKSNSTAHHLYSETLGYVYDLFIVRVLRVNALAK